MHLFGITLTAKNLWRIFSKPNLWRSIIEEKYIKLGSLIDWIRCQKVNQGCFKSLESLGFGISSGWEIYGMECGEWGKSKNRF